MFAHVFSVKLESEAFARQGRNPKLTSLTKTVSLMHVRPPLRMLPVRSTKTAAYKRKEEVHNPISKYSTNGAPLSKGALTPSMGSVKESWKRETRWKSPVSANPGRTVRGTPSFLSVVARHT